MQVLDILPHIFCKELLVDDLLLDRYLLHLLVIDESIQISLLRLKLSFLEHILFELGLMTGVDLLLELVEKWVGNCFDCLSWVTANIDGTFLKILHLVTHLVHLITHTLYLLRS